MEEKDKLENGSQGRSMSDADKEYYADLYNDLPKEVQDILMQTHPLMGRANEDTEAAAYRTRRPQREDVEEVKEARMQQTRTSAGRRPHSLCIPPCKKHGKRICRKPQRLHGRG